MPTFSPNDSPAHAHAIDLGDFVSSSPSSFHAAAEAARRLSAAGFVRVSETDEWPRSGRFYCVRDGAIIAWAVPDAASARTGFRVLGSHTDSPTFKLKPRPTTGKYGWLQAGVEVYGGPLLNSWLDRELALAGSIVTRAGVRHLTRTGPLLRFPQLAIHLDRGANDGLKLDKQQHMNPVWGLGDPSEADLVGVLAEHADVDPSDVAGYDVVLADTQAPRLFGGENEFLASSRLDNLSSVHAGVRALEALDVESADRIAVLAAFDHEEVGSSSRSGACGPFLDDVLSRISGGLGATDAQYRQALASSVCVSADAGHSVHPNYPGHHDPANLPIAGGGPLLKINANQRYATDGPGAAIWQRVCAAAGVPTQEFVSNNQVPCGSTIGPLTATRIGIRTIDVGVPLLSMHSARELTAVTDPYFLGLAAAEFLRSANTPPR
nr:M18 family aminopeptidase [Spelaeicoccus albus]